jgi:pre-rRNA-processing protein TSR3
MFLILPTIILRHRRENLKKCSLRGLECRPDCLFFTYTAGRSFFAFSSAHEPRDRAGGGGDSIKLNTIPSPASSIPGAFTREENAKNDRPAVCPREELPDLSRYFLLTLDGPPLSVDDGDLGIFLIDGTWRYAELMEQQLPKPHLFQRRSLPPGFKTAYPRRQEDCPEPSRGLASVEALFLAHYLLGRNTDGLLDHFYWKDEFLKKNADLIGLDFLNFDA